MNAKISRKHHYLPRYYLRGFANEKERFFIYDKKEDKFFGSTPNNSFYQSDLNTINFSKTKKSDFLEAMYGKIESNARSALDHIRKSDNKAIIDPLDKAHVFFFLLCLHWRLPSNFSFLENHVSKLFSSGWQVPQT